MRGSSRNGGGLTVVSDLLLVAGAGLLTALVTGLGAVPVFALGGRVVALRPLLWGAAAGLMTVASVVGLLAPALDEGSALTVGSGLVAGVLFLVVVRWLTGRRSPGADARAADRRAALIVFVVLLVHSFPEGLAIGTAAASDRAGLDVFVIAAIALQNIPEGTSTALPMAAAGSSRHRQVMAAIATSLPQPPAAVLAFLLVEQVRGLLPWSFAFAAGAMLSVVAVELAPRAFTRDGWRLAGAGAIGGGAVMLLLAALVGV